MTALDIGVIVVTVFFLARGVWLGFVRQLAFLLALVFGYMAAGRYYPAMSGLLAEAIANPKLRFVLTYALLFFVTYVLIMVLGLGLKKVMQVSFLGWFDRLMGGVFGLTKAAFLATLVFMALSGIFTHATFIDQAFFTPYLRVTSQWVASIVADKKLQQELLPQPAISDFLRDSVPTLQSLGGNAQ